MSEVPHTGEDHGQAEPVSRFDDFGVALRAAGLDDRSCADSRDLLDSVGKGEKSVRGSDGAFQWKLRLHSTNLGRVYAAHLSRPDAHRLSIASVDDGVGLDVLTNFPCE